MGFEANATLPAGGWECFQEEAAAELRFERRVVVQRGSRVDLRERRIFQAKGTEIGRAHV